MFGSHEPKAHKQIQGEPVSVVPSLYNTFKHEYLCNKWADRNQILTDASLDEEFPAIGFGPDQIRTLVSMATDSSHRVIMGKIL